MPANYVLLEKITVGAAGASSVTFNSIPQTGYTDLVVSMSIRSTAATTPWVNMRFNGASTNYSGRRLEGDGSTASSASNSTSGYLTLGIMNAAAQTSNTFSSHSIYIPNYTSANYKSTSTDGVSENNATAAYADLTANLWSDTSAITSILLIPEIGSFAQYSTFYLYGVAKLGTTPAIVPYATGGDTIMTDGTYWYHAFKSSGTFTPATGKNLSCDVLVVAGGGGGGNTGGGGGAGGVFYATSQSLASGTGYTATIGAGGAGGAIGVDSTFASLTAAKGGGIGGAQSSAGGAGGSGGGSWSNNAGGATTQTGTGGTGYGFVGGGSLTASAGHGGGGAGAAGGLSPVSPAAGGNGGAGLNTWSAWLNATGTGVSGYIAGGGGGIGQPSTTPATGGAGGGGAGAAYANDGTAGTANTGGGGGAWVTTPRSGGSGLVIVRYAV